MPHVVPDFGQPRDEPSSTARGAVEEVWRREASFVLAALLRRGHRLEDGEDAAQEAFVAAAEQWPVEGAPDNPRGWLIRVASRRLVDAHRSTVARERREVTDAHEAGRDRHTHGAEQAPDRDDSLHLLILCAHPSLSDASAVALTLRAVAGLTTRQIAAGLLCPEPAVAQRIGRAKRTLREQRASFGPVPLAELPRRLYAVRHTLHLIFTSGSTQVEGSTLVDVSLTGEAIRLTERLHRAAPRDGETTGLLALMLLVDARTAARTTAGGDLVPLGEQDRSRWDHHAIGRAVALLEGCLPTGPVGPFQLQAAIAAVHATAPSFAQTDWPQILELYRMLQRVDPSPSVELGAAIATVEVHGPAAGLEALAPLLRNRPRDHRVLAAYAHVLESLGDPHAAASYERAADLTRHAAEERYLRRRLRGPS